MPGRRVDRHHRLPEPEAVDGPRDLLDRARLVERRDELHARRARAARGACTAAGWRAWPRRRCRSSAWGGPVWWQPDDGGDQRRRARRAPGRQDARAGRHPLRVARRGPARRPRDARCCAPAARPCATSATRACSPAPGAPVLLAGHLDTVPAQGNRPGRRDAERVHGLGASDMKGAVAVMLELALAGAPLRLPVLRPRGAADGRERADAAARPRAARRRARRDDGADRQRDPRRLPGQHQRDLDLHGPRRALRAPVGRRQRDPQGRARDRRARRRTSPRSTTSTA